MASRLCLGGGCYCKLPKECLECNHRWFCGLPLNKESFCFDDTNMGMYSYYHPIFKSKGFELEIIDDMLCYYIWRIEACSGELRSAPLRTTDSLTFQVGTFPIMGPNRHVLLTMDFHTLVLIALCSKIAGWNVRLLNFAPPTNQQMCYIIHKILYTTCWVGIVWWYNDLVCALRFNISYINNFNKYSIMYL